MKETVRGLYHRAKRPLAALIAVAGGVVLALEISLLWYSFAATPHPETDGAYIWHQAERIRQDVRVYASIPDYGPHFMTNGSYGWMQYPMDHNPHLPLLASITALLPRVDLAHFQRGLSVLLALAVLGLAVVQSKLSGRISLIAVLAWLVVLHASPDAFTAVRLRNPDPFLWLLFASAVAFKPFRGAGLAVMATIKPHAIWPLAFVLFREPAQWRSALAGGGVAAAIIVAAMGPVDLLTEAVAWVREVAPDMSQGTFNSLNVSLSFGVLRIAYEAGWWTYESGPITALWPRVWLAVAQIGTPIAVGIAARKLDVRWQISWVMLAALLASPLCWTYYLTVGWVPVALWIARRRPYLEPILESHDHPNRTSSARSWSMGRTSTRT